jgi:hypothetical protein
MRDQSGVIPKETFCQLSPESRKAWSQLSDDVWVIFFGLYRQMAANVPRNLLTSHLYMTNQGTTEHGYLRMLRST